MNGSTEGSAGRSYLTVRQMAEKHSAWSEASLRKLIFFARDRFDSGGKKISGNGLESAIIKSGGRILIDEDLFLKWVPTYTLRGKAA